MYYYYQIIMSGINIPSESEMMQLVFADILRNILKPLAESWDLKSLRVHKRYLSMPNMAVMGTNSSTKATEIGWRSTPNLKFLQVTSDIRRLESHIYKSTQNIPASPN